MDGTIFNTIFRADYSQLKDAGKAYDDLKGRVANLASEVPGLDNVMSALKNVFSASADMTSKFGAGLVGLGASAAAAAVAMAGLGIAMAFNWNEKIGALNDLGDKLGISANQAMYLKEAMQGAGLGVETLITAQEKLAKSMMKSGDESKGAGEAFARLKIETTDQAGQLRATGDVLDDITAKYKNSKGNIDLNSASTQELADLQLTLGKNYREVLMAQVEMNKALEIHNEMMEAGIGISTKSGEIEEENAKAQMRLKGVLSQMGSIMQEIVIPAWTELTNWFVNSYKEGGVVVTVFNMIANSTNLIIEVFKAVIGEIGVVVDSFINLGNVTRSVMSGVWQAMRGDFSGGVDSIMKGVEVFADKQKAIGLRQIELIKNSATGIAGAVADVWNNRNVVGEAQERNKADPAFSARTIRPSGGAAGGTPNATKEAKEKKDPIEALVDSLNKQLRVSDELNISERIALELQDKKYANSNKLLKQQAQDIADKITLANANKSVQALTDGIIKQTNAVENMNEVMKLEVELQQKKNQGADEAIYKAARSAAVTKDLADAHKAANKWIKDSTEKTDDFVRSLMDEIRYRAMSERDIKMDQELKKLDVELQKEINDLKEKNLWNLAEETRLIANNAEMKSRVASATDKAKEADKDWVTNGLNQYVQGLGTMEKSAQSLLVNGIQGLSQGISSAFTGAEFDWRKFLSSFLKGIADMIIQFMVIIPLIETFQKSMKGASSGGGSSGLWGSVIKGVIGLFTGGGGFGTGAEYGNQDIGQFLANGGTNMGRFAAGGVMSTPTTGYFGGQKTTAGESGPEAILPLQKNSAGQLGVAIVGGVGGGGSPTQVNNITINGGSSGNRGQDTQYANLISTQLKKNWMEMNIDARRPGGVNNSLSMAV